jgi:hypothetical protein
VKNFNRKSEFHLKILVCFVAIIEKRINLGAKYKARVSWKSEIKIIYSFEIYATLTDLLLIALDFELFMFNLNNYFRRYSPAGLTYIVDFMLSLKEKEESTILKFLKCH